MARTLDHAAKNLTLEAAAEIEAEYAVAGQQMLALGVAEYMIYREIQEATVILSPAWSTREAVSSRVHAQIYGLVARYNRLATMQCASSVSISPVQPQRVHSTESGSV